MKVCSTCKTKTACKKAGKCKKKATRRFTSVKKSY